MPAADDGRLPAEIGAAMARLDELIDAFEMDPDEGIGEMAAELLQSVDTIHRAGVTRLAAYLAESGDDLRRQALAEPSIRLLFELYDLLPDDQRGFIPLEEVDGSGAGHA